MDEGGLGRIVEGVCITMTRFLVGVVKADADRHVRGGMTKGSLKE